MSTGITATRISARPGLGLAMRSGRDTIGLRLTTQTRRFILLISAHLESGHYFNPHAQRIIEGMMNGAKLAVMDTRLSNTASMADYWMATYPGSRGSRPARDG